MAVQLVTENSLFRKETPGGRFMCLYYSKLSKLFFHENSLAQIAVFQETKISRDFNLSMKTFFIYHYSCASIN